jgi:thiamine-phosphate pyrophosphorylase
MPTTVPNRCRIVLVAPPGIEASVLEERLRLALAAGDAASLIVPRYDLGDDAFQQLAERLVPLAQAHDVAAIVAGDTRVAGRVKADGIHIEDGKAALAEAIGRYGSKLTVGAGGAKTRDDALELGEEQPDYVFFGRFGYDNKPEPHSRNLTLGRWWAAMIEIPCIVLAGSETASAREVAETGAEFVALSAAILGDGRDPATEMARANALLDEHAPRFEDA